MPYFTHFSRFMCQTKAMNERTHSELPWLCMTEVTDSCSGWGSPLSRWIWRACSLGVLKQTVKMVHSGDGSPNMVAGISSGFGHFASILHASGTIVLLHTGSNQRYKVKYSPNC